MDLIEKLRLRMTGHELTLEDLKSEARRTGGQAEGVVRVERHGAVRKMRAAVQSVVGVTAGELREACEIAARRKGMDDDLAKFVFDKLNSVAGLADSHEIGLLKCDLRRLIGDWEQAPDRLAKAASDAPPAAAE